MVDKDQLKRLSPEERIKRLKELEAEHKKELDEAQELIKASIGELNEPKEREPEEWPEEEPSRPSVFEESKLEEQVRSEQIEEQEDASSQNVEYMANLYGELAEMASESSASDDPYAIRTRATELYEKIKETEQYQSQDQTIKKIAEGSRRLMAELFGEYRANLEYTP